MNATDLENAAEQYREKFATERPNTEGEFRSVWDEEVCMLAHFPRIFEREGCVPERYYLRAITNWKRMGSWEAQVGENDARIVRDTTKQAFASGPTRNAEVVKEQMDALTSLYGVGPAIASTVLTFRAPEVYTVMDWRALEALAQAGEWAGDTEADSDFYPQYLERCHQLAEETGVALRDVDRALWILGEEASER